MKRLTAWLSLVALCALVAAPYVSACPKSGCGSASKEKVAAAGAPKACHGKKAAVKCGAEEGEEKNCTKGKCAKKAVKCDGECEGKDCEKAACEKAEVAAACEGECEGKDCAKANCVKAAKSGCGEGRKGACGEAKKAGCPIEAE